ncbi:MAG: diaminopimelate epimerase [Firmicutes bacterium]|jgi:diaminopimelate epimerase|nr:diaminopimelate epimerase [Bacillota bacterium]
MKFVKMHGCGNDYVLVNCFEVGMDHDWHRLAREISDRHFGVGSDGLILVMPPSSPGVQFRMRMFNSDGSEGEMCGNGMRCFAKYVYERGLTDRMEFAVETPAGIIRPRVILRDGLVELVRVDMGVPSFERAEVPMIGAPGEAVGETLAAGGAQYTVTCVSMGNPHCVVFVDDLGSIEIPRVGPLIERHEVFPEGTNVEFVQVLDRGSVRMGVWERGSGRTLACGTGACASAAASHRMGFTGRRTRVVADGGILEVELDDSGRAFLTGPAEEICSGVFTKWREPE